MNALAFSAKEFYFQKVYLVAMMGLLLIWIILYNLENKACDMDGRKRSSPNFFHYMFLQGDWHSHCNIFAWIVFIICLFRAIITYIYGVSA